MGGNGKKRILIVEDEPLIIGIYEDLFGDRYRIESVDTCDKGLEFVENNNICGVIVDILLRGRKTGLDFLTMCNGVPTIVVTALGDRYEIEARQRGAKDYFTKPFKIKDLEASVDKHFY